MAKLAINVGIIPQSNSDETLTLPSSLEEELAFTSYRGSTVLLFGQLPNNSRQEYFATATLDSFSSGRTMNTFLSLIDVRRLAIEHPCGIVRNSHSIIHVMSDEQFSGIIARSSFRPGGNEEEASPYNHEVATNYRPFTRQMADRVDGRCSYSHHEIKAVDGVAIAIQPSLVIPLEPTHFIYLHKELARLFDMLAWTVGPDFELIPDTSFVGHDMDQIAHTSGKLLLPQDEAFWPDQGMLAWHRHQFFRRLH